MKLIILFTAGFILYLLGACSTDVDFGEQYKKMVYIVNSNNNFVKTDFPIAPENEGSITFYCGGTEFSKKDIIIQYEIDTVAMNTFNKNEYGETTSKYMVAIPKEAITFHQSYVTIKAGEEYGILNFSVNTENLNPSVVNTIPITITETSEGEINPKLKTLFYTIQVQSPYAGKYDVKIDTYNAFSALQSTKFVQKTAKTVAKNIIRVPLLDGKEVFDGKDDYYEITINEEDNTISLSSPQSNFGKMAALIVGGVSIKINYYNPETKEIIVYYQYPNDINPWTLRINTYEALHFVE